MRTVMHIGSVAIAAVFALALAIDAADARRGGGGGGMRGGGMRAGGFGGGGRAGMAGGPRGGHISQPIARPGGGGNWANRPGGGGAWANRPGYNPGWNNAGWGYRPGWGAAAAVGAGLAYGSTFGTGYGSGYGYYDEPYQAYSYQDVAATSDGDAVAECARRFKTYDPASQTYIKSKGVRASCP